jgi:sugar (pentulose or hexulose) kinase
MIGLDLGTTNCKAVLLAQRADGHVRAKASDGCKLQIPHPRSHRFYKQHHRQYTALCRGMVAMGE